MTQTPPPTTADMVSQSGSKPRLNIDWLMLALAFILYFPLVFFGYGSDNDTYGMLDAGHRIVNGLSYQPSRQPGYPVVEAIVGLLARMGGNPVAGSILCNLATMTFALIVLVAFQRICEMFFVPHRRFLTLILIVHPVFWTSAGCTIDYMWALAPLLVAFVMMSRGMLVWAGILSALAIGSRFTSAFGITVFFIFFWFAQPQLRRRLLLVYAPLTIIPGLLLFLPSFRWAHYTLAFLRPGIGDSRLWTFKLRAGRWGYKNIYFWGLPGTLLLVAMAAAALRRPGGLLLPKWRWVVLLSVGMVVAYQGLYFAFPIERAYMLPLLPFFLILLGIIFYERPAWLFGLLVCVAAFNFVNLNIARPDNPDSASAGNAGLWVEKGFLLHDLDQRLLLRGARSLDDYQKRMGTPATATTAAMR